MVVVLLTLSALLAGVAVWAVHRHAATSAWNRELENAFGVADRKEMPRHRVL
jgi:hypothetical protein